MKRMKLKEWNNVIYSNIDGPREYLTKWTKAEEEKDHIISLIWGKKKKEMIQVNLVIKQKHTHRLREWTFDYREGKGQGIVREFGSEWTHCYI